MDLGEGCGGAQEGQQGWAWRVYVTCVTGVTDPGAAGEMPIGNGVLLSVRVIRWLPNLVDLKSSRC